VVMTVCVMMIPLSVMTRVLVSAGAGAASSDVDVLRVVCEVEDEVRVWD
jgi:hypothetical protein